MADKVNSLMHELEMIHSTMATLKDIAGRQRDYVRKVNDHLVAKAVEGTVEVQLTQEMLENEAAFLDQVQKVISEARGSEESDEPNSGNEKGTES